MKFLSILSIKDIFYTLPLAERQKLMKALINFMKQPPKAGKVLEMYTMAGWNRAVVIAEHKSAESLVQAFTENPMSGFYDWETYPIAEITDEMMKAMLESMKAA